MARIKNGILGPIVGSIANVTGCIRLGVPVLKKKIQPTVVSKHRTPKQKGVTTKFQLAMQFIKPVTPFINIGFSLNRAPGQTAHNVAVSKILAQGFKGDFPDMELNFPNIIVTHGGLAPAENPRVELENGTTLRFSWDSDPEDYSDRKRDQVMLLAFSPETHTAFFLKSGARRSEGTEFLQVYPELENQSFQTYISFISDDRQMIANSSYIGEVSYTGKTRME
jgi:hypothetical protein